MKIKWWMWASLLGLGAVVYYYTRGAGAQSFASTMPTLASSVDGRPVPVANVTKFLQRAGIT